MTTSKAYHRTRPVRIAFLVEEHPNFDVMLDAIFSNCLSRWGGRFNLVVPCLEGKSVGRYTRWLEVYDADIIYSYVDLNSDLVAYYHETFGPSNLVRHDARQDDPSEERHYWPDIPIQCLASLSTIGLLTRPRPYDVPSKYYIAESFAGNQRDRFIEDNFGSFWAVFHRSPFPRVLEPYVAPLTIAPKEVVNRRSGFRDGDETVPNSLELLRVMTQKPAITLGQLSACGVRRLDLRQHKWARHFCITIGNSGDYILRAPA